MKPPKNRYSTPQRPKRTVVGEVKKTAKNATIAGAVGAGARVLKDIGNQPGTLEIKDRIGEDPMGEGYGHVYSHEWVPGSGVFPEQIAQNAADWGLKAAGAVVAGKLLYEGGKGIYNLIGKRNKNFNDARNNSRR